MYRYVPMIQCPQISEKDIDSPVLKLRTSESLEVDAGNELWSSARKESTLILQAISLAQKFCNCSQLKYLSILGNLMKIEMFISYTSWHFPGIR